MQCVKVNAMQGRLLDPQASEWGTVPAETLKMDATPLANQPSEYIKASRDERKVGKVRSLTVQSAHDGTDLYFRLTWEDPTRNTEVTDTNVFPDECGILMPLKGGDPPIDEMGSKDFPVNAWFWSASFKDDKPKNVVTRGLGTTEYSKQSPLRGKSQWVAGKWSVVLARSISVPEQKDDTVQLAAGDTVKVGFAVWEGSAGERGGVKSFSKEWRELKLQA